MTRPLYNGTWRNRGGLLVITYNRKIRKYELWNADNHRWFVMHPITMGAYLRREKYIPQPK